MANNQKLINSFHKCKCWYCEEYHWPVVHEFKNLYWYEIPKNGSLGIKKLHNEQLLQNKSIIPFNTLLNSEKPKIAFVRDPIERFKSCFIHFFVEDNGRFEKGKRLFKHLKYNISEIPIEDRLEIFLNQGLKNDLDDEHKLDAVHHFFPQTYFLDFKVKITLVNLKDINQYFPTIKPNHQRRTISDFSISESNLEKIKEMYKYDYRLFNKKGLQL